MVPCQRCRRMSETDRCCRPLTDSLLSPTKMIHAALDYPEVPAVDFVVVMLASIEAGATAPTRAVLICSYLRDSLPLMYRRLVLRDAVSGGPTNAAAASLRGMKAPAKDTPVAPIASTVDDHLHRIVISSRASGELGVATAALAAQLSNLQCCPSFACLGATARLLDCCEAIETAWRCMCNDVDVDGRDGAVAEWLFALRDGDEPYDASLLHATAARVVSTLKGVDRSCSLPSGEAAGDEAESRGASFRLTCRIGIPVLPESVTGLRLHFDDWLTALTDNSVSTSDIHPVTALARRVVAEACNVLTRAEGNRQGGPLSHAEVTSLRFLRDLVRSPVAMKSLRLDLVDFVDALCPAGIGTATDSVVNIAFRMRLFFEPGVHANALPRVFENLRHCVVIMSDAFPSVAWMITELLCNAIDWLHQVRVADRPHERTGPAALAGEANVSNLTGSRLQLRDVVASDVLVAAPMDDVGTSALWQFARVQEMLMAVLRSCCQCNTLGASTRRTDDDALVLPHRTALRDPAALPMFWLVTRLTRIAKQSRHRIDVSRVARLAALHSARYVTAGMLQSHLVFIRAALSMGQDDASTLARDERVDPGTEAPTSLDIVTALCARLTELPPTYATGVALLDILRAALGSEANRLKSHSLHRAAGSSEPSFARGSHDHPQLRGAAAVMLKSILSHVADPTAALLCRLSLAPVIGAPLKLAGRLLGVADKRAPPASDASHRVHDDYATSVVDSVTERRRSTPHVRTHSWCVLSSRLVASVEAPPAIARDGVLRCDVQLCVASTAAVLESLRGALLPLLGSAGKADEVATAAMAGLWTVDYGVVLSASCGMARGTADRACVQRVFLPRTPSAAAAVASADQAHRPADGDGREHTTAGHSRLVDEILAAMCVSVLPTPVLLRRSLLASLPPAIPERQLGDAFADRLRDVDPMHCQQVVVIGGASVTLSDAPFVVVQTHTDDGSVVPVASYSAGPDGEVLRGRKSLAVGLILPVQLLQRCTPIDVRCQPDCQRLQRLLGGTTSEDSTPEIHFRNRVMLSDGGAATRCRGLLHQETSCNGSAPQALGSLWQPFRLNGLTTIEELCGTTEHLCASWCGLKADDITSSGDAAEWTEVIRGMFAAHVLPDDCFAVVVAEEINSNNPEAASDDDDGLVCYMAATSCSCLAAVQAAFLL